MTEADVVAALRKRYSGPAWAFIPQVRNGTGFMRVPRTADALAMALWPSRGLELIGFEIKVSRSDWLAELRVPAKAEDFFAFCDRWYLVTAGEDAPAGGTVQAGELPPGWGHMTAGPRGVKVLTEAERRKGQDVDRLFLAAILRRMLEATIPRDQIAAELETQRKAGETSAASARKWEQTEHQRLQTVVGAFEKASGVRLADAWSGENIGRAVRDVMEHGPEHFRALILSHRDWLKRTLVETDSYLAEAGTVVERIDPA